MTSVVGRKGGGANSGRRLRYKCVTVRAATTVTEDAPKITSTLRIHFFCSVFELFSVALAALQLPPPAGARGAGLRNRDAIV